MQKIVGEMGKVQRELHTSLREKSEQDLQISNSPRKVQRAKDLNTQISII